MFVATKVPGTGKALSTAPLLYFSIVRNVQFIAAGAGKATGVQEALYPQPEARVLSAVLVTATNGNGTWVLDSDTASSLAHGSQ